MDSRNEGYLLIATFMVLFVCFAMAVLAVMLIYRRRRIQHNREIHKMNERFEKELLKSQLEVQNQTMEHIGRELHDHVGSQLTLAYLYTHQVQTPDESHDKRVKEIGSIINESLSSLRGLSSNLIQGGHTQNTSLDELIREECSKLEALNFCAVSFENRAGKVPGKLDANIFVLRILQEFAQNSLKHAQCQAIRVELSACAEGYLLAAQDDGIGFELTTEGQETAGMGLRNLKQRAEIIHAQLNLHSSPGQGTRMELHIPPSPDLQP